MMVEARKLFSSPLFTKKGCRPSTQSAEDPKNLTVSTIGGVCNGKSAADFHPGNGGCLYSHGDCKDFTVTGCKQKHARNHANDARKHFSGISSILGSEWLAAALIGLGVILMANPATWWFAPIISGLLTGLGLAFTVLGNMASAMAGVFSGEGSGQLTKARLDGDMSQISDIAVGRDFGGAGIAILGVVVTFFTSISKGAFSSAADATQAAINIMKTGMTTFLVEALAVTAGTIIFEQQADDYIRQEEADLA